VTPGWPLGHQVERLRRKPARLAHALETLGAVEADMALLRLGAASASIKVMGCLVPFRVGDRASRRRSRSGPCRRFSRFSQSRFAQGATALGRHITAGRTIYIVGGLCDTFAVFPGGGRGAAAARRKP